MIGILAVSVVCFHGAALAQEEPHPMKKERAVKVEEETLPPTTGIGQPQNLPALMNSTIFDSNFS